MSQSLRQRFGNVVGHGGRCRETWRHDTHYVDRVRVDWVMLDDEITRPLFPPDVPISAECWLTRRLGLQLQGPEAPPGELPALPLVSRWWQQLACQYSDVGRCAWRKIHR